MDFAILVKVPFNRNLGVVTRCRSDVLVFLFARSTHRIIKLSRGFDIAITVQIMIVNQPSIGGRESVSQQIIVGVIRIFDLNDRINPLVSVIVRISIS